MRSELKLRTGTRKRTNIEIRLICDQISKRLLFLTQTFVQFIYNELSGPIDSFYIKQQLGDELLSSQYLHHTNIHTSSNTIVDVVHMTHTSSGSI